MSVFVILFFGTIGASIEEAMERRRERVEWARRAPRRARRYTFN